MPASQPRFLRVLLLEDNPSDAELVLQHLRRAGFELEWVRVDNQDDFVANLAHEPDLVLADFNLPQFDAVMALEVVRGLGLDIPFIIVSGGIGEDVAVTAMQQGAADYLLKDRLTRLGPAVHRALAEKVQRGDRRRAETALRESEQRFRRVFEEGAVGMALASPSGQFQDVNETLARLLGYREAELLRLGPATVVHPDEAAAVEALMERLFRREVQSFEHEGRWLTRAGETVWVHLSVSSVSDEEGTPLYGIFVVQDISDRKRFEAELQHQALHDHLTQLPNRSLFMDRLAQAVLAAHREDRQTAILMIDMDRFKEVNDSLGHSRGDALLRQVAERLTIAMRDSDTVARLGGDEFAVIPAGPVDEEGSMMAARRILAALDEPFHIGGASFDVGASVGVAVYPDHGADAETLMRRADVAMYVAKRARTGYSIYAPGQDEVTAVRLTMMAELRRAIGNGELRLHYQPQVDIPSGRPRAVEALVRWQHPTRGVIGPDEFIPAAEQSDLSGQLTRWVVAEALRQVRYWRNQGIELDMALNLSVADLHDASLPDQISGLLERHKLPATSLTVEITERAIMVAPAQKTLRILNDRGIAISIDDFGTGYSSLSYLRTMPVAEIKVDKSFVSRMAFDEDDATIVRATIDLGHNLRLKVLAEGAENTETIDMLRAYGCDYVQGYHISRPMPASDVGPWLLVNAGQE